jgi:hypothetical protein
VTGIRGQEPGIPLTPVACLRIPFLFFQVRAQYHFHHEPWGTLDGSHRVAESDSMQTFTDLVISRKAWIENDLKPWCARATFKDLRLAEQTWGDIAGKVDPEKTLWFWAWCRFPALVNLDLKAIDESRQLTVTLRDGRTLAGYPDARQSQQGRLVLLCADSTHPGRFVDEGPFTVDEIAAIAVAS